jgi:hypothetical protein
VLNNSVNKAIGGKLDDIDARLTTQEVELKHVNACLNRHEQMFRNNKLVFSGLVEGEYDNDELKGKIIDIATYLGVQINFYDIVECFRISKRLNDGPRMVLVGFLNKEVRNAVYFKRGLLSRYRKEKVFINEDLEPNHAKIFYEARKKAKELGYFRAWTNNGVTYVKPTKESRPLKIESVFDIQTKLKPVAQPVPQ